MPPATVPARLALADGTVFLGAAFGDTSPKAVDAEVCFNTSMAGYQEILTDPSYAGQIVTMTYPLIGNYGVNDDDLESARPQVEGFVVRELSHRQSNYRSTARLEAWLASHGVTGLMGIDTRALTRRLRTRGALNGVLCTDPNLSDQQLVEQAQAAQGVNANLAAKVSRTEPLAWDRDLGDWAPLHGSVERDSKRYKVVALDCGAKLNILRNLVDQGCDVTVLPWDSSAQEIMKHEPDGLFVSNGPGDPAAVEATVGTLKQLLGKLPIFGICLGHQLLCLALGAKTYKLPFGHRGANHPIQNLGTGKVEITSQNHGFAVDTDSVVAAGAEPTHINLNDNTLAGFRHATMPIFAIQYHPEASPGPHDARYLFDCFIDMMATGQSPSAEAMDRAQRQRNRVTAAAV
jgi:carbamoyl-phosphate synthase small subunit